MKRMVIILIGAVLLLAAEIHAAVLKVPGRYHTIQDAINAAVWGDTVLVTKAGEYVECISLKDGVTVQGEKGPQVTTIRGDGSVQYAVLGASNSTITGFTITGGRYGILTNSNSTMTIANNIIAGNEVYGIFNNTYSSVTVTKNIITNNPVGFVSDSEATSLITDNIFTGNGEWAIGTGYASSTTVTNNTITNNNQGIYARAALTITNNIITSNRLTGITCVDAGPTITFNDIWGNGIDIDGCSSVADNISVDPLFVNHAAGDYHLQTGSLCVDSGTNNAPSLPTTDFDGNPRVVDGTGDGMAIADMGAYELY